VVEKKKAKRSASCSEDQKIVNRKLTISKSIQSKNKIHLSLRLVLRLSNEHPTEGRNPGTNKDLLLYLTNTKNDDHS
jgi:hypothetical protein